MASMALPPYSESMLKNGIRTIRTPNKKPTPDLTGQTCIVTGSNSGIGLATAHILPTLGVTRLIMGVRSVEKGEKAAAPIRKAHPNITIDVWELDMLSYPSIQTFAARCSSLPRLDIAILNAGIGFIPHRINKSTGHEETVQVNYLSTALLSILLLPVLARQSAAGKTAPGRLTIVGSGTALFASFANVTANPLLPSFDTPFSGTPAAAERYGMSKVLVLMLVHKLATLTSPDAVIINTVEPGLTAGTQLHRDWSRGGKMMMGVMKRMSGRTTEQAAATYIDAIGAHGRESHGGFLLLWEVCGMPKVMHTIEGKEAMERLWRETMAELEFADVEGILKGMGGNSG